MLQSDGDVIRGLGFVTLYSAYLEEEIDDLLQRLGSVEAFDEEKQRWPISRKVKQAKQLVARIGSQELDELSSALDACPALFEKRNEVVHGRIYAGFNGRDNIRSGRPNVPVREIDADELYELANEFWDFRSIILRPKLFTLQRVLAAYVGMNRTAHGLRPKPK